jgi:glutamine amidotransferase/cyclase
VPLTVGGGIRGFTDANGIESTALQVADAYFRAGADKISIGSDAVDVRAARLPALIHTRCCSRDVVLMLPTQPTSPQVAKEWLARGKGDDSSSIETISRRYGRQAVVVSIDPRRRWVAAVADADGHDVVDHSQPPHSGSRAGGLRGPNGETLCWYECTVQGGRKGSGLDVIQLARAVEALGCGELLVNCIDHDGQNDGYDLALLKSIKQAVTIPVIASSGAGNPGHFSQVFQDAGVEAGLAASIFHRDLVTVADVKSHCETAGFNVRRAPAA